ncbi:hypothetical protein C791_6870 [Amycolatopsis azurea DSM 43854]|uniref:Uncharacterized protein n=1 Tax=Amycolatopsis azurea DSM 43854 TaxID=1238180 RepID=M2PVN5_9PSEU|nr:hypothetical protein C791_6870 [Amycolatopsis azurea DSM 43854]
MRPTAEERPARRNPSGADVGFAINRAAAVWVLSVCYETFSGFARVVRFSGLHVREQGRGLVPVHVVFRAWTGEGRPGKATRSQGQSVG